MIYRTAPFSMTLNDRYPQFQGYAILWRWISRVCTVVQYAVQYAVLEAMTRVYGKTENSTPRKYKMDKDIQTPLRIYDYVAELSCCAQFEQNRLTQFCWGNRGSLSFNSHTHRQSGIVKQILLSRLQITNIEGSDTFMAQNAWFHAQMCLYGVSLMTNHL